MAKQERKVAFKYDTLPDGVKSGDFFQMEEDLTVICPVTNRTVIFEAGKPRQIPDSMVKLCIKEGAKPVEKAAKSKAKTKAKDDPAKTDETPAQ